MNYFTKVHTYVYIHTFFVIAITDSGIGNNKRGIYNGGRKYKVTNKPFFRTKIGLFLAGKVGSMYQHAP